jgi:hypothetical protein
MADSVRYSISVTPVEEISDENSQTHTILASEVNATLGCSGVATCASYAGSAAAQGYSNAAINYGEAVDDANDDSLSAETSASFVFVKNTGFTYSSATVLGAALDKSLKVMSGTNTISILDKGEAIVLKDDNAGINGTDLHVRTVDTDGSDNSSAGHLAYEYLVVD